MNTEAKKQNERRQELAELSHYARTLKEEKLLLGASAEDFLWWEAARVNDIVLRIYQERTGCKVFNTFEQWKKEGYHIKKGSKAFVLWSRKIEAKKGKEARAQEAQQAEAGEDGKYKFFPLAYLFSELQVELQSKKGGANVN